MAASRLTKILTTLRSSLGIRWRSTFAERQAAEEAHAGSTLTLWKRVSLFVAIPGVLYLAWKNLYAAPEELGETEFVPWPHMRIRNKPFPWGDGDKSLFHNPHANLGPDTAADEEEEEEEKIGIKAMIAELWLKYLLEDPEEREAARDVHLRAMQKRHFDYLKKRKNFDQYPLQPMDFFTEMQSSPFNHIDDIK